MPNAITSTGIQTATQTELVANLTAAYQAIYGADINLGSDTPDGQMMMIFIQSMLDMQDLLVQIYNSFDPDLAIGVTLDERCALNGIQRQAGTFTLTNITLTTDRALNLSGLDAAINDPNGAGFTVADNAGNQWILAASQSIGGAGSYPFQFRAKNAGSVLTVPNTITVPITIVLGVTAINNPTAYTSLGLDEETDAQLRIRRQKSVALSSQGYLAGLLSALLNINGVTSAFVYENNSAATDADGTPSHSIWVIVNGGDNASIANAVYSKRNAGAGMRGAVVYTITQRDGTPFQVRWDVVTPQNIYIQFNVHSMNGVDPVDPVAIADELPSLLSPGVYEPVNINEIATLVQRIDPNALVTNAGLSTSPTGPFTNTLTPTAKNYQFAVASGNIAITVI